MAKKQNTFEKRRRDMEKKLRAEDKRKKRLQRKANAAETAEAAKAAPPESNEATDD